MRERAFERAAERFGLSDMLATVPTDEAELVIGFTPWADDTEGWVRSVSRSRPEATDEPRLSRTVWDHPEDRGARVAIDVYECDSADEAVRALVEVLAGNHLASVPRAPESVGLVSFAQPENLPPAVMMVRANLCLVVSSFGTTRVAVLPWAQRLDSRIIERPQDVDEAEIFGKPSPVGDWVALTFQTPWRVGEEGYVKIFSEGGPLELRDGQVLTRGDDAELDFYVVEPGRPTYHARTILRRP